MIQALLFNCPYHYWWPQFWRIVVLIDRIFTFVFPVVYLLLGAQPKECMFSGKRNMKILGYDHKCNFWKACAPISRQNINRCYSAAIFWEILRENKQSCLVKLNMHLKKLTPLKKFSSKRNWEQMKNLNSFCEKSIKLFFFFSDSRLLSLIIIFWLKPFPFQRLILLWINSISVQAQKMDNEYLTRSNFLESMWSLMISWKRG